MGTGNELNAGGNFAMDSMDQHLIQEEVDEILLIASYYKNRDKLLRDEPLRSYADLT